MPTLYYDFAMWQFSDKGIVDGIPAEVDLNLYFIKKCTGDVLLGIYHAKQCIFSCLLGRYVIDYVVTRGRERDHA